MSVFTQVLDERHRALVAGREPTRIACSGAFYTRLGWAAAEREGSITPVVVTRLFGMDVALASDVPDPGFELR